LVGEEDAQRDGEEREGDETRPEHGHLLAVVIDYGSEPDAAGGGDDEVDAREQRRPQHGVGLEVHPVDRRGPHEEVRDVGYEVVGEQVVKRAGHGMSGENGGGKGYKDGTENGRGKLGKGRGAKCYWRIAFSSDSSRSRSSPPCAL